MYLIKIKNYLIEKVTCLILFLLFFDPKSSIFKINEIICMIYMFIYISVIKNKNYRIKKNIFLFYSLYFFIPVCYALLIFYINNSKNINLYYINQNIRRVIFASIIFPMSLIDREKLKKYFINNLKLYSLFILVLFVFQFIVIYFFPELGREVYWWGREKGSFLLHTQNILNMKIPSIFTGNILLLVFLLANSLFKEKSYFYSILSFLVLLQSRTAANILSGILIIVYYIYSKLTIKIKFHLRFIYFNILGFINVLIMKNYLFNNKDAGNTIKYLHIISYFEHWKDEPIKFLLGDGLGTGLYTKAYNKVVYLTEIFYFEIIRIYGFIIFLLILFILLFLFVKIIQKNEEWLAISYLSYLCISGTNPYLFGVIGSLVISLIFCFLYNDINKKI